MERSTPSGDADYSFPHLAEVRTFWRRPWLVGLFSQHGLGHFTRGEPMQDAHLVGGHGPHSWIVVADGVGSAKMSQHASKAAVESVGAWLAQNLLERPNREVMLKALAHARDVLLTLADELGCKHDDVATTLALAVFTGSEVAAATIGDSSILALTKTDRLSGGCSLVPFCSAPQPQARYPGATGIVDLAHPYWMDYVETSHKSSSRITALLLATDGAGNFFSDGFTDNADFDPEFTAAYQDFISENGPLNAAAYLAGFTMQYEGVDCDDRTLVIASKIPFGQFPGLDALSQ